MKNTHQTKTSHSHDKPDKLTFRQHLQELRKRVVYIVISLGAWSVVTYAFEKKTIAALIRPARHQQFIYTSPIGGVDFMFRVSLYIAFILSIPVIFYNILSFIEPLLTKQSKRFITIGALASGILAAVGIVFGYFVGLPSAMHFLLHQFVTSQIKPLLTIQAYLSFVMVYMLGSAMMLQIPLILIFINRVKPLKPSKLLHYERWVILGSFVVSGIMNPTPNLWDQLLVAGPLIIMYQVGILIIAVMNRERRTNKVEQVESVESTQAEAAFFLDDQEQEIYTKQPLPQVQAAKVAPSNNVRLQKQKPQSMDVVSAVKHVHKTIPKIEANDSIYSRFKTTPRLQSNDNRPRKYVDILLDDRKINIGSARQDYFGLS